MNIYGHKNIKGDFNKVIELSETGFIFENKEYQWKDITKIKRYDSIFWSLLFYQGGTPRAYIYLNDKKCIKLFGKILQKEGVNQNRDFVSGASTAYRELIETISKNRNT